MKEKVFSNLEQELVFVCLSKAKTPTEVYRDWRGKYSYQYIQSTLRRLELIGIMSKGGFGGKLGSYYKVKDPEDKRIRNALLEIEIRRVKEDDSKGKV